MALYDRLMGIERPKIAVHSFMAVLAERRRGQLSNQQVADALNLTQPERQELLTLVQRVTSDALTAIEIHDVLILAEAGVVYLTPDAVRARFGV